jgi:hypothetical protein
MLATSNWGRGCTSDVKGMGGVDLPNLFPRRTHVVPVTRQNTHHGSTLYMFLVLHVPLVSCGVLGPNWLAIDNI